MVLPIGGAECTFIWRANGATREQTHTLGILDISSPPLPTSGIALRIANAFGAAGAPGNAGQFSNEYRWLGVSVTYMDITGPLVFTEPRNVVGSFARPTPPINCSLLVDKRTLTGGRRGRGRMFVPPAALAEGDIDSLGTILAVDVTNLQISWTLFYDALIADDLFPQVYHATPPLDGAPVISFQVQSMIATQRRRMRR